jgi:hypothetical protein
MFKVCNSCHSGFQILPPTSLHTGAKMVSQVEKAKCVLWFHEAKCVITVQRRFQTAFGKEPPSENSIHNWYKLFEETSCIRKWKSPENQVPEGQREAVRAVLVHTPNSDVFRGNWTYHPQQCSKFYGNVRDLSTNTYQLLQDVTEQDKDPQHILKLVRFKNWRWRTSSIHSRLRWWNHFSRETLTDITWESEGSENPHAVIEHMRECPNFMCFVLCW